MKRILFGALVALAAAWMPIARADALPTDHRIVLLVDEWKAVRNLPVVVAERLGYLKADGMDVTVMNVRDDVWHGDMLMDGRIDAVMAYWHHNVVNHAKGRETQAIVTLGVTPGAKVLVAQQAKDKYRSLADLKGSRIITGGAGSSKTTVANALMLAAGLRLADYTRLPTEGKDANVAALRDGAADLVVAPTPDGAFYESKGVVSVFADLTTPEGTRKAFGAPFPTTTIFMATERVKAHPEIARHLAGAFVRALEFIHTHSAEEIVAIVPAEVSGKDREKYLQALKEALPMFSGDGRMSADGAQRELHALAAFDPKLEVVAAGRTYTNVFVDDALARLH